MPADVRAFFDAYRDAFNRLDGRAVSAHYDRPALIVDAAGNSVFADGAALDANNVALCEQYAKSGFLRAGFETRAFLAQGDNFCVANLAWTIERHHQAPQRFNTSYALAKRNGTWKVATVTAYEERPWSNKHG
jgi:ketosteroid isomerase-like protein